MSWARLDDQYTDHPKIVQVGPLGMALHVAAICYCARYLTDGFVPAAMIPRLLSLDGIYIIDSNGVTNAVTHAMITEQLTDVGLFEKRPGGYFVHDYLKYNPTGAQVKAEREATAERQRNFREKHRKPDGKFGGNANSNGVTNTAPSPSPSPDLNNEDDVVVAPRSEIFTFYENEIGTITPMISDALIDAEKNYPAEWIKMAVREAVNHNARSWKYVSTILKNWKTNGIDGNKPNTNGNGRKPTAQENIKAELQRARERYANNGEA